MDKKVVIFAGNDCKGANRDTYLKMAHALGRQLAENGLTVVTGAGSGLMEEVARGAHEAGGKTIGIGLNAVNGIDRGQSPHIHEYSGFDKLAPRQDKLISTGDAYIALPGGVGTVFEVFNIIALKRLGEIPRSKPLIMLGGYYRKIPELMNYMTKEGFLEESAHSLYNLSETVDAAVEYAKNILG